MSRPERHGGSGSTFSMSATTTGAPPPEVRTIPPQVSEARRDDSCGPDFLEGELRVPMEVPAEGHQIPGAQGERASVRQVVST